MQTPSHREYGDLPLCDGSWLKWSWNAALADGGAQPSEERIKEADLLEVDWTISKSVRTLVLTGTYDPNCDEGLALSKAMVAAGMTVETIDAAGSHAVAHLFDKVSNKKMVDWWRDVLK